MTDLRATALDGRRLTRRACLGTVLFAAFTAPGAWAAQRWQHRLAATWEVDGRYRAGVLVAGAGQLHIAFDTDLPTRAHGLLALPGGHLLVVARRPGDWLLRWDLSRARPQPSAWCWAEPGRVFNGHAALAPGGRVVYTTETATETGAGLIGMRDARSLRKLDEWPTGGIDPHAVMVDPSARGVLWVANGGVPTAPETGRAKRELHRMDSSLVRLDTGHGRLLSQWRLTDPRLSLRHLAHGAGGIGIALQAEHDDPTARDEAPVLAMADDQGLRAVPLAPGRAFAGYGGDIAALGDGFAVSTPRVRSVAAWQPASGWTTLGRIDEACALVRDGPSLLAASRGGAVRVAARSRDEMRLEAPARIDNHWVTLPG